MKHQPRQAAVQSQSSSSSGSGAKSDYNANISPLGSSVSSSSSQYQYANQQSSTVVQAFPPIMGLLNTMQSQFAQGSLTQTAAASQMAQVAQMLGPALTQLNGCNCAGNAGVMSSASQAFQTMSSLMQSFSSRWGASSMGSIVSPANRPAPQSPQAPKATPPLWHPSWDLSLPVASKPRLLFPSFLLVGMSLAQST
ncbi:hypothetical protein PSTT_11754 [Puccinia striiformis]|uniref:Uncharacterized protein n=1 Tax=Puccinia striiformis TaxID=27350 RepID=A0A2S4UZ08_9BASI|nr:hypothetical protein PSTT_11754 [Puccinia striiformis]